ncbi:MAG: hypothetical protein MUP62_00095, partial [Dehalococcoidia bacterium]|nr:hypothetical protein [Dehalococcoidia bacterium]
MATGVVPRSDCQAPAVLAVGALFLSRPAIYALAQTPLYGSNQQQAAAHFRHPFDIGSPAPSSH